MDKFLSLLILWLQLNCDLSLFSLSEQGVSQSPEALSVREGGSVDLNCSYPDSALYFLRWFRQDPGKGLTSLLSIQANQKEQTSGRITVSLDKPSGHSALHIATSQHSDSDTYLCVGGRGGGRGAQDGGGTGIPVAHSYNLRFYSFLIFACGAKISLSILLWLLSNLSDVNIAIILSFD
ncbi:hypothetical protein FD755_013105 [Muntiacus reevesi]|uniref:Ig-like domain-containing protein n=1 Tax=Muntiacus reevesi TaxID=9886 RepID=A0A5N3XNG9_MUNRE|nr:hypothetical protein FD755_013105 [Muntiacus reevesi]